MSVRIGEKEIDQYVNLFNSLRDIDQWNSERNGSVFLLTEDYIDEKVRIIRSSYPKLTSDICEVIKKRIMATFDFYQEEGDALLSDYAHEDWYHPEDQQRNYWNRYFNWLKAKNPDFGSKDSKFDSNTDAITNLLGNPSSENPFAVHGLVMGDVQSGKTATYIGVICKAVDAGYKVIVLLTGLTESLRKQTQRRVNEGFIGFDSEKQMKVGVGLNSSLSIPRSMTSTRTDYRGNTDQNTASALSKLDNIPLILVCKKNVSVLKKIYAGLSSLNLSEAKKKIDSPLLVIDDEADNASINTNRPELDPTQINQNIKNLLSLFRQSTYVGFTATPFANVFIQPTSPDAMQKDDLFPRDFIYSLKAPNNYIGPSRIFSKKGDLHDALIILSDANKNQDLFSFGHKKDWDGTMLFPSFYESIITFCLANAIRDIRGDISAHRSMLINMSRFIDVQKKIATIAEEYLQEIKKTAHFFGHFKDEDALANPTMMKIYQAWKKRFEPKAECDWQDVKKHLYSAIKNIKVVVVNSKSAKSIDYEAHKAEGLRVIAVGGLALSRGLTLEGLMTSYFYRNTSTYDVLMQMGRWFGYRPHYEDLMRIWIPADSAKWYGEIADAIEQLRGDITTMIARKKTPMEFGVRVRNDSEELSITAPNKMRNAVDREERYSFYGGVFENTFVTRDTEENEKNWDLVDQLSLVLPSPDNSVKKPYYRGVPAANIIKLLEGIIIPKNSIQFDREQIVKFLKTTKDPKLKVWDVLIASKGVNDEDEIGEDSRFAKIVTLENGLIINPIVRTCIETPEAIAISGGRSHIGSRETKYGLSREQITQIEKERKEKGQEGTSQKLYMIPDRNPLLIIYAVFPNTDKFENGKTLALENYDLHLNNRKGRGCFVAFSVAIPRSESKQISESHLYKVNRGADYYMRAGYLDDQVEEI